jgi:hypothetical protein
MVTRAEEKKPCVKKCGGMEPKQDVTKTASSNDMRRPRLGMGLRACSTVLGAPRPQWKISNRRIYVLRKISGVSLYPGGQRRFWRQ